jgi:hypothetical protein
MKKTIKLTPVDPWKELWLQKEYDIDSYKNSQWEKVWDIDKDEEYDYISASEKRFLKEWQDITRAAETNVALQDLLDQVKMMYKLTKIK